MIVRDIKSIHSIGARSIPKVQRSSYLELYTLKREKDRLEKEVFASERRGRAAKRQLDDVDKRIEKLQKEAHEEQKTKTCRHVPARPIRPMKSMPISY